MTKEETQLHLDRRRAKSVEIFRNPENFKVCEQCNSIAVKKAGICPHCHAYRWLEDKLDVQATAMVTGKFPFPTTSPIVPRI